VIVNLTVQETETVFFKTLRYPLLIQYLNNF